MLLFCNNSDVTVHLEMKFNRSFKLIERKPYETRLITILAIYFSSLMTIELKKLKRWLKSNLFNLPRNCNHLWLYRIEFPSGDFLVFEKKNKEMLPLPKACGHLVRKQIKFNDPIIRTVK